MFVCLHPDAIFKIYIPKQSSRLFQERALFDIYANIPSVHNMRGQIKWLAHKWTLERHRINKSVNFSFSPATVYNWFLCPECFPPSFNSLHACRHFFYYFIYFFYKPYYKVFASLNYNASPKARDCLAEYHACLYIAYTIFYCIFKLLNRWYNNNKISLPNLPNLKSAVVNQIQSLPYLYKTKK